MKSSHTPSVPLTRTINNLSGKLNESHFGVCLDQDFCCGMKTPQDVRVVLPAANRHPIRKGNPGPSGACYSFALKKFWTRSAQPCTHGVFFRTFAGECQRAVAQSCLARRIQLGKHAVFIFFLTVPSSDVVVPYASRLTSRQCSRREYRKWVKGNKSF